MERPATYLAEVIPDDATDLPFSSRALNGVVSGAVRVTSLTGNEATVHIAAGSAFPVRARRVWATGTPYRHRGDELMARLGIGLGPGLVREENDPADPSPPALPQVSISDDAGSLIVEASGVYMLRLTISGTARFDGQYMVRASDLGTGPVNLVPSAIAAGRYVSAQVDAGLDMVITESLTVAEGSRSATCSAIVFRPPAGAFTVLPQIPQTKNQNDVDAAFTFGGIPQGARVVFAALVGRTGGGGSRSMPSR